MIKKRVFKIKSFTKWMKKCNIHDQDLLAAIIEMDLGLIDADLGGNVYKKRIRLPSVGKRSGARMIAATQLMKRWFLIYGFAKNEKSNVSGDELLYLHEVAKRLLHLSDNDIDIAIRSNEMKEVRNDEQ